MSLFKGLNAIQYKEKIIEILFKGRLCNDSVLSKDFLPRDIFKIIFNMIINNINITYSIQYLKFEKPICLDYTYERVECNNCGLSFSRDEYINPYVKLLYDPIQKNTFLESIANFLTVNCGCKPGQCDLCINCNKLYYIPRIAIMYCENHKGNVKYSRKTGLFCNMMKKCPGVNDFKDIGNDEALISKLKSISITDFTYETLFEKTDQWFKENNVPGYQEHYLLNNMSKFYKLHDYLFYEQNGFIYDCPDNDVYFKKLKTEEN